MKKELNYRQIYLNLTKNFPKRVKNVLTQRFGFEKGKPETLELVGKNFGITRERVRQIQEQSFSYIKRENKSTLEEIFQNFFNYFKKCGNLKKEDILLTDLGRENFQRYIYFFLTLGDPFFRYYEKREYFPFWSVNRFSQKDIENTLSLFVAELKNRRDSMGAEKLVSNISLKHKNISPKSLFSFLEISKDIGKSSQGLYGLKQWPEIHPRGVKDRAYLTFKKEKRPLHFMEVARLISSDTLVQTVHNELIKDPRFVLVGRGIYALKEWGYTAGTVKDVISEILRKNKQVLTKDEIVKKVLNQRLVKKNTILMSLNDKNFFIKNSEGKYILRKTKLI